MKFPCLILTALLATAVALAQAAPSMQQVKADLMGQTMGGREKSWKFQSPADIQELVIKSQAGDSQHLVYIIGLKLQSPISRRKYAADARVDYLKAGPAWKIKQVGLLSIAELK